jgi:hypothetical protein
MSLAFFWGDDYKRYEYDFVLRGLRGHLDLISGDDQ